MACRALSQRNNDPTKASRPWDVVSSSKVKLCTYLRAIHLNVREQVINHFTRNVGDYLMQDQ